MTTPTIVHLGRLRWAVRLTLAVGVAASMTANVLHADPHPVSQCIAAWPPLALLLTVELFARVPVHRRSHAVARLIAAGIIAGIAAWVSYWHMAAVASRYGEVDAAPYLLPLSVDGLIVVASVSLVELAGRIRAAEQPTDATIPAVVVGQSTVDRPQQTIASVVEGSARPGLAPVAGSAFARRVDTR